MEEKYILVEVYGSKVICNCPYSSLETAKESLRAAFDNITNDIYIILNMEKIVGNPMMECLLGRFTKTKTEYGLL